ncbi:hypothetical protein ZYGR_0A01120 [Zygosaccharomyces rouxii]|uniref:ZYRO0A02508p n=2 Tax=Zygosaccharomyces rouxii TaxID=4956 RepID=C5DPD6_ZYGRC|nr:uncharacterized protein ZYRO0A02508g [Zygosaccharomyces rouxii]KAH9198932.1 terpenoid cyclases/protein prenyltransferase alpha-alpha toroid [Zygosaccharomyces rouxii]GAV46520.1 hypothetical protein ZYGR_0A01120 [Zygosaccharomyces rouxii]CAR25547.1 ZYRO0A02508p [Zygosaccharomyces rouxii]
MSTSLESTKHVKFLKRHLLMLPSSQQSHDVNRIAIIFYSIVGLSALGVDCSREYASSIPYIYQHYVKLQIPGYEEVFSGFVGSLATNVSNTSCISLPNTLFALLTLRIMKCDEFFQKTVDRESLGNFIRKCQYPDGSFASVLDMNKPTPSPVDSTDLRFCYIAAAILRLLGCETKEDFEEFIDVDRVIDYMMTKKCDFGGFGDYGETHAGYTSCALCAFQLLHGLDKLDSEFKERTVDWLLHRQVSNSGTVLLQEGKNPYYDPEENGGFQGRENKFADTCYAFWCLNSLKILDENEFNNVCRAGLAQDYLLTKTQNNLIGGFSKNDEDDPDLYHTCLGIAVLQLMNGTFDGIFCIPKQFAP